MPADSWEPPISLRIVAFGFILAGTVSAVDMIARLLLLSQVSINLGALLLFVGYGLLRWRDSSRQVAVFLSWMLLFALSIWILIATFSQLNHELVRGTSIGDADRESLLFGILLIGYTIWQLRVLRRPEFVRRFKKIGRPRMLDRHSHFSWKPWQWRFGLGSLFFATVVVAVVILELRTDELWWTDQQATVTANSIDGREMRRADYVVAKHRYFDRLNKLRLVLLTRGKAAGHGISGIGFSDSPLSSVEVRMPDGDFIPLSERFQLYEFDGGQLRHCNKRILVTEFESFIASKPAEWSIDALVKYAETMRAQEKR